MRKIGNNNKNNNEKNVQETMCNATQPGKRACSNALAM